MESTRLLSAVPRVAINDPTILTPPPVKSLSWRPASVDRLFEPTKTAYLGAPGVEANSGAVLPRVGDIVLGFKLVDKLGEGGFGSVFLGEQLGLAARPVALKFTRRANHEPELLASLQHANIVPVYSVHTLPPIQVLCMPYLGRQTLHDVLQIVGETRMLPATGAGLLSTINAVMPNTKKRTKADRTNISLRATPSEGTRSLATPARPQPVRELLCRLSYPDSVVWLFTRLAEGLAHAHDRGILHLDLKPSNVLVTDDGVPMILDFGLAHDLRSGTNDQTGGTLRYMAPEQLEAYGARRTAPPDARLDLYALGVMFYELLTGVHPFDRSSEAGLSLPSILGARRTKAVRPRLLNPRIAPSIEAVIMKLLQPQAENRYASAGELLTDLTLHQQNRPLAHTRNPSLRERLGKYRRRHPVLAVMMLAAAFGLTAFGAAGAALQQSRQRSGSDATIQAGRLHEASTALRIDLTSIQNPAARVTALKQAELWFDKYGADSQSNWRDENAVARLAAADRERLTNELGDLALLCAYAERLNASGKPADEKIAILERALTWNRVAQTCFDANAIPPAVREQRRELQIELADQSAADIPDDQLAAEGPRENYLRGLGGLAAGDYKLAIVELEKLAEKESAHGSGQFSLAVAYQYAGRYADAIERFQIAKALCPRDPRPALNRGLALAILNKHAEAIRDFTTAIDRDPKCGPAFYNRSLSLARIGMLKDALADATKSLDFGESPYRTFLLRASIQKALGNTDAADRDRAAAAKIEPRDEADYMARGAAKLPKDPAGALADFAKATELNPRYTAAWQNQAHVLSEYLDQPEQALDRLDSAVKLNPGYAPALVGRAVVLARTGKRKEAVADAEAALAASEDPLVRYQVACVYALSAKANPGDAGTALEHLRIAFRDRYNDFATVDADTDLANLRGNKEFETLVASAKELRTK